MEEKGQIPTHVTWDHCLQVRESPAHSLERGSKEAEERLRHSSAALYGKYQRTLLRPDPAANSEVLTLQLPCRTQEAPTC